MGKSGAYKGTKGRIKALAHVLKYCQSDLWGLKEPKVYIHEGNYTVTVVKKYIDYFNICKDVSNVKIELLEEEGEDGEMSSPLKARIERQKVVE